MKKAYTKPQIMFESFTLTTNIAGDCDPKTYTPSQNECAYETKDEFLGTINVFISTVEACTTKEADGEYNGFCYDIPFGQSLFNS